MNPTVWIVFASGYEHGRVVCVCASLESAIVHMDRFAEAPENPEATFSWKDYQSAVRDTDYTGRPRWFGKHESLHLMEHEVMP